MSKVYLITHLNEHFRDSPDMCYELQELDTFGQAERSFIFGKDTTQYSDQSCQIPKAIAEIAADLLVGESKYVDESGMPTYPGMYPDLETIIPNVFFVRALADGVFEIDVVNKHGQSIASAKIGKHEQQLRICNVDVPNDVIVAVRSREIGAGDYVDKTGDSIPPGSW